MRIRMQAVYWDQFADERTASYWVLTFTNENVEKNYRCEFWTTKFSHETPQISDTMVGIMEIQ